MPDDPCACCGPTDERRTGENERDAPAVIETASPLDADLPTELQSALGRFLGDGPVRTLGDWAAAVRRQTGGGPIAEEELCHTDGETGHWGDRDGKRYHFACFYDAVVLAAMSDRPVEIRTESPDGTVIEASAVGGSDLTVSPSEAVFSFGIDERVVPADRTEPTLEDSYAAICPYVKAFPDREAYERWATTVSVPTAALPLAGATELAEALVAERA